MKKKLFILLLTNFFVNLYSQEINKSLIIINPAHGGKEFGVVNYSKKIIGKNVNLEISKLIAENLNKTTEFEALLTRDKDEFVDIYDRAYISNSNNSTFFVSINCYKDDKEISGTEIFTLNNVNKSKNIDYSKFSNSSIINEVFLDSIYLDDFKNKKKLIYNPFLKDVFINIDKNYIEKSYYAANSLKKYLKLNNYTVNENINYGYILLFHHVNVPSLYVFIGNINNEKDLEIMTSKENLNNISQAIINSLIDYKNKYLAPKPSIKENIDSNISNSIQKETPIEEKKEIVNTTSSAVKKEIPVEVKQEIVNTTSNAVKKEIPVEVKQEIVNTTSNAVKKEIPVEVKQEIVNTTSNAVKKEIPVEVKQEIVNTTSNAVKKEIPVEVKQEIVNTTSNAVKKEIPIEAKKEIVNTTSNTVKKETTIEAKKEIVNTTSNAVKKETTIEAKKEVVNTTSNVVKKEIPVEVKQEIVNTTSNAVKKEIPVEVKQEIVNTTSNDVKKEIPVEVKQEIVNTTTNAVKKEIPIEAKKEIVNTTSNAVKKETPIEVKQETINEILNHVIEELKNNTEVKYFLSNTEIKNLQSNLYFEKNNVELKIPELIKLNTKIDILKKHIDLQLYITCHTDSRSNFVFNQNLSNKRAEFIKYYITNNGIASNRLRIEGKGEDFILNHCKDSVNCTDEEHQINRRAEFRIE